MCFYAMAGNFLKAERAASVTGEGTKLGRGRGDLNAAPAVGIFPTHLALALLPARCSHET